MESFLFFRSLPFLSPLPKDNPVTKSPPEFETLKLSVETKSGPTVLKSNHLTLALECSVLDSEKNEILLKIQGNPTYLVLPQMIETTKLMKTAGNNGGENCVLVSFDSDVIFRFFGISGESLAALASKWSSYASTEAPVVPIEESTPKITTEADSAIDTSWNNLVHCLTQKQNTNQTAGQVLTSEDMEQMLNSCVETIHFTSSSVRDELQQQKHTMDTLAHNYFKVRDDQTTPEEMEDLFAMKKELLRRKHRLNSVPMR